MIRRLFIEDGNRDEYVGEFELVPTKHVEKINSWMTGHKVIGKISEDQWITLSQKVWDKKPKLLKKLGTDGDKILFEMEY